MKSPGESKKGSEAYLLLEDSVIHQIPSHALKKLNLFLGRQACYGHFHDTAEADSVQSDEGVVVHVRKEAHDELAVHAVRNAAVTGDRMTEILNLEGPFQTRREETSKGRNQRCKCSQDHGVELHRRYRNAQVGVARRQEEKVWQSVLASNEDGVRGAF